MIHLPLPYPAASASPPPSANPPTIPRRQHPQHLLLPPPSPLLVATTPTPPPTSPRAYHPLLSRSVADLLRRCPAIDLRRRNSVAYVARHPDRRRSKIGVTVAGVDLAPLSASQSPAMISWPRTFVAVSFAFAAADPASPVRRRRLRSGGPRLCPRPPRSAPLQPVQQHRHCRQEQHPRPDCQQTTRWLD